MNDPTTGACPRRRWPRTVLPFALALLLAGCAGLSFDDSFTSSARRLFSAGYDQVANRYIEPVNMDELAVTGLNGLSSVDPSFSVERRDGELRLTAENGTVASLPAPANDSASAWAKATAAVLAKGRETRPLLGAAEPETLYEAVFDAALKGLDGFTRYADARSAREERARRVGFGGIGIRIQLVDDMPQVLSVIADTPADKAGVRDGDRITEVDGTATMGVGLSEVVDMLRGPVNTDVVMTIRRQGAARAQSLRVRRQRIIPPTVTARYEGDLLYLQISTFNQDTAHALATRLDRAQAEKGTKLHGIILDLRDNPGGLLDQAVAVSDMFLAEGNILTTRGRHPQSYQTYSATESQFGAGLPMVVLINGNTASASEVVAAALQDRGRAVLVGSNSFGKGTVQTVIHLPNDGELILTWSRIHAPSGYSFNRIGILPAVCTSGVTEGPGVVIEAFRRTEVETAALLSHWRRRDLPADAVREPQDQACPADKTHRRIDMQVADAVIHDQVLYGEALRLSYPEVAARPDGTAPDALTQ